MTCMCSTCREPRKAFDCFRAIRPSSRIGGELEIDGAPLFAKMTLFPRLERGGMYAFFVDYLPRYKTFDSNSASGTLAIADGRARSLIPLSAKDLDFAGQGITEQQLGLWVSGARCR